MREQIQAWIRELRRELALRRNVYPKRVTAGQMTQAQADAHLETLQSLHDFLQALLEYDGEYQATEYARQMDALRWCIDKLGQGEPTPQKQAARNALIWARATVAAHWAYRALQLDLQKRLQANDAEDIPAQIVNTSVFDLTAEQCGYALGLLRQRTGKFFPPTEPPTASDLELTGG